MLAQADRSSTRIAVLMVAFVTIGMIGLAFRSTTVESGAETTSAVLTIGDTAYGFTPTACTVTSSDFLAAGSGEIDGEDFWISVSPEAAELAMGTADERTRSDDVDDRWLMNDGPIDWSATDDGAGVEAQIRMGNERLPDTSPVRATFRATCSS